MKAKPIDWDNLYWLVNELAVSDERFTHRLFGIQPLWTLRRAATAVHQRHNMEQLSQARNMMMFANCNRAADSSPHTDIADFLPHPDVWRRATKTKKLNISRATAIEVISSLPHLDVQIKVSLDSLLSDINAIASGD